MLKVLHCIPGMGGGGAERQLAYLAGPLAACGWDVHVALRTGGANLARLERGGATVHMVTAVGNHDPRLAWRLADLFRRVRAESRSLVLGDQVEAEIHSLDPEPGVDFLEAPYNLAEWCGGEVAWSTGDLAVVRAVYD